MGRLVSQQARRRPKRWGKAARGRPVNGQVVMLAWLEQFLVRYPELALFLVISAGYWIGSFKVGAFSFAPASRLAAPSPACCS